MFQISFETSQVNLTDNGEKLQEKEEERDCSVPGYGLSVCIISPTYPFIFSCCKLDRIKRKVLISFFVS